MYCKDKIYAGTEEFSFEELRAARIFAKIREGTYVPVCIEKEPENNVRYMYPKKDVYSFDGEFQYEEILARRYLARPKKRRVSSNQVVHSINTSASGLVVTSRGFPSNAEPCPMDIGSSCQKSVASATGKPNYEHEKIPSTSASLNR